jgi:hypothetical protein
MHETLVHTASIVAVLETFSLALFSAASARGQWKSPFPLTAIQEPPGGFLKQPPVEMLFPLAVLLRKPPVERFSAFFKFSY